MHESGANTESILGLHHNYKQPLPSPHNHYKQPLPGSLKQYISALKTRMRIFPDLIEDFLG